MYKYPYLLLKQSLEQISILREAEIDHGQENQAGAIKALPIVLIKFQPVQLRSLGQGVQEGQLQFDLKVITKSYRDGKERVEDPMALDHYEVVDQVHQNVDGKHYKLSDLPAYAGLSEGDFVVLGSVSRIRGEDRSSGSMLQTIMRYETRLLDKTSNKSFQKVEKYLEVENLAVFK